MSLLEAIIIGIIQGATEFLPISSDGHLVLVPTVFGLTPPDLVLIGLVHAGTLLAILSYFWRDLIAIARDVLAGLAQRQPCLLYTSPSPRDRTRSRMPSSA